MKNKQERIKLLKLISSDMKADAENFDGKPFDGHTVATYFGNQGAAISAIAELMALIIEEDNK